MVFRPWRLIAIAAVLLVPVATSGATRDSCGKRFGHLEEGRDRAPDWRRVYEVTGPEHKRYQPDFLKRLGSYDPREWKGYLEFVAAEGDDLLVVPEERARILPILQGMPERLREKLLLEAGTLYPRTTKALSGTRDPSGRTLNRRLPSKRSLDTLISDLLNADRIFAGGAKRGKVSVKTLDKYLKSVRKEVFPSSSENGRYGSAEVIEVVKVFQDHLKSVKNLSRRAGEPYIILGGSFPNGRAGLTGKSDIDLIYSHSNFDGVILNPRNRDLPDDDFILRAHEEMLEDLKSALLKSGASVKELPVEARWREYASHEQHERFFLVAQPLTIKITPDRVEIRVLPRTAEVGNTLDPRTAPTVYLLDLK